MSCRYLSVVALGLGCSPGHGRTVERLTVDGLEREYVVYVPPGVDDAEPAALVFMLHGTSGSGDYSFETSHWAQTADAVTARWERCASGDGCGELGENERGGMIVVFPTALELCVGTDTVEINGKIDPNEWRVVTKWASGVVGTDRVPLCPASVVADLPDPDQRRIATQTLPDDVEFFRAMVADVEARYPIDPARIYADGFSSGAQMSARLAADLSDTFAAVATAAGPPDLDKVAPRPLPVLASVGTLDSHFLPYTDDPENPGNPLSELPMSEAALDQVAVGGWIDLLARQESMDPSVHTFDRDVQDGVQLGRFVYEEESSDTVENRLEMLLVKGAIHEYPNGENNPLVLSDLTWTFFDRHAR
jgi:poly(3-hydroxybutyrate) depolymerase